MTTKDQTLPHWDLTNVYPSLDSDEFQNAFEETQAMAAELDNFLQENNISRSHTLPADADPVELGHLLEGVINRLNTAFTLLYTVSNYVSSFITTDSYNSEAKRLMSQIDEIEVKFDQIEVTIKGWIGALDVRLKEIINSNPTAQAHAFFLQETAEQSRYLMSDVEEGLAAELSLSGIRAWNKLHGTITSQLKADIELDGEIKSLPLPALQNVRRYNHDETIRRKAFDAEIEILASMREPLAACMNGVKGYVNVLNQRRGRADALHPAIDQSRIDRATLEAMMSAMQASFPTFRKYLKAKANRFGKHAADILYADAESGRATLQTTEGRLPTQFTLAELEERLGRSGFFRAHRGYLVNLQHVKEVIPFTRNSFSLRLDDVDNTEIPLSKSAAAELKDLLGY